jgi:alginate O-acetyltransferase complex protein AlgI
MLFPTFPFFVFFCVVFAGYWTLPRHRWRMLWLLTASCYFYMSWNPYLILLILFSASIDYVTALCLERQTRPGVRRALLIFSICCNLGLLAFFKYTNFFLDTATSAMGLFGLPVSHRTLKIILPLGISFYTFETISYVVDVYRGRTRAVRSLLDYALYIMFFPHLVAGPIVRPRDFLPQLRRRKHFNWDRLQLGAQFFLIGLFKKAVLADQLAGVADPVFADPAAFGSGALWLAVLCYSAQIFCDFSGYSDMAVGLAHTLGFRLPMNFNMPYLAANITDFWRRWHISLSTWLRDYLYIPLGGNRHGTLRTYANLMLTMLLGGLWHGASWTFVVWGLYHGLLLAVHRAVRLPAWFGSVFVRPLAVAGTFLLVSLGWVFFRAETFAGAAIVLRGLFSSVSGAALDLPTRAVAYACLACIVIGHLIGLAPLGRLERRLPAPVLGALLACLLLAAQLLVPEDGKAFIYFQF